MWQASCQTQPGGSYAPTSNVLYHDLAAPIQGPNVFGDDDDGDNDDGSDDEDDADFGGDVYDDAVWPGELQQVPRDQRRDQVYFLLHRGVL